MNVSPIPILVNPTSTTLFSNSHSTIVDPSPIGKDDSKIPKYFITDNQDKIQLKTASKKKIPKQFLKEIESNNDLTNTKVCLIDRNDNLDKKCPSGWDPSFRYEPLGTYTGPTLNVCCKDN